SFLSDTFRYAAFRTAPRAGTEVVSACSAAPISSPIGAPPSLESPESWNKGKGASAGVVRQTDCSDFISSDRVLAGIVAEAGEASEFCVCVGGNDGIAPPREIPAGSDAIILHPVWTLDQVRTPCKLGQLQAAICRDKQNRINRIFIGRPFQSTVNDDSIPADD